MIDALHDLRMTLTRLVGELEPDALSLSLSGEDAVRVVAVLGVINRLTEGFLARSAKRVSDTSAYVREGDCDAAQFYARVVGAEASDAHRVLGTAKKLERLPATAAAVREGRLSGRQAELVAGAATRNPEAELPLLEAAASGMVPLKDACVRARAEVDDLAKRAARHHRARRLRTWTADDGMFVGMFRLAPEIGGQVKAVLDAEVQRIFRARRTSGEHEAHDAYAADALVTLMLEGNGAASGTARKRAATNVHVVIDHQALVRGTRSRGSGARSRVSGRSTQRGCARCSARRSSPR